jgi:hypothetical protein
LFRALAVVIALGVGFGSALLDGCVVSCHPGPLTQNARTGHCHTIARSQSGSHLQDVARCCHDAASGLADRKDGARSTLTASGSAELSALPFAVAAILSRAPIASARHVHFFAESETHHIPLRV